MPVVSYDDFISDPRYASFDDADEDLVNEYLADAEQDCPADLWTYPVDRRARIIKLYVAHWLTLDTLTSGSSALLAGFATGGITSISASQGSRSVSFGDTSKMRSDDQLALTKYGQQILELRSRLVVTGFST